MKTNKGTVNNFKTSITISFVIVVSKIVRFNINKFMVEEACVSVTTWRVNNGLIYVQ